MPDDPASGRDDPASGRRRWALGSDDVASTQPDTGDVDELASHDGEMPAGSRAGFRFAAFGALLIVVLFAGYGLGRLNNGVASASAPPTGPGSGSGNGGGTPTTVNENQPHVHNIDGTVTQGGASAPAASTVGGLSLSSGGLTLVPSRTDFIVGEARRLEFRIVGPGGAAMTTYAIVHDKPLHLIVVRRDLSGFQHLHPTMAADGTWGVDLTLAEPGIYRMVADFTAVVGGQQLATTLGGDLTVAGQYSPRVLPAPASSDVVDGFTVAYEGKPGTAATQPMLMNVVAAGGKPAALEPYLGAFGHLVVMRQGDLAYVHAHPETRLVDGKVEFWVTMPSAGRYRMFFDFQVAGTVRTADWTAVVS